MNKRYYYFVSYNYGNKYSSGSGMTELSRDMPIKTFEHIKAFAKYIEEQNPEFGTVVITNYIRIKPSKQKK